MPDERSKVSALRAIGRRILTFESLPSTNDYAAELASQPNAAGTVVIAQQQTAGRGQFGREWHSPTGAGLWMSVIVEPPPAMRLPAAITAWATVAVAEAIRPMINRQPAIKWPNDILVAGKKVAGILIEQRTATIVGIGLNINQTSAEFAAVNLPDATSLRMISSQTFDVDVVTQRVIDSLNDDFQHIVRGDSATLESCWTWRTGLLGRMVAVELINSRVLYGRLVDQRFDVVVLNLGEDQVVSITPEQIRRLEQVKTA